MTQNKTQSRIFFKGDKVEPRRKWIEDNVKFTLEEATVF